jgi:HTH-type transcriptional regulator / antitoxin HigA
MKHEILSTGHLLKRWTSFRDALGFSAIRTAKDYKRANAVMDQLLDEVGENESHPLADVLD